MTTLRFLPQTTLDGWIESGAADLRSGLLVDLATKQEMPVREAVHFIRIESGEDTKGLLRKVKTVEQVKALGGEQCMTSVLVGEDVYEVVPGWLAEEPSAAAAGPSAAAAKAGAKNAEADMLAKLLLDKLS